VIDPYTDPFADPFAEEPAPPPTEGDTSARTGASIPTHDEDTVLPDDPGEEAAGTPTEADVLREALLQSEYERARLRALLCLPPDGQASTLPAITDGRELLTMEQLRAFVQQVTLEKLLQQQARSNLDAIVTASTDRLRNLFMQHGASAEATVRMLMQQEKGRRKSIQLVEGVLGFRATGGDVSIRPGDEPRAKAVAWAVENAPEVLRTDIDLKVFKAVVLPELFEKIDEDTGETYFAAPEFLIPHARREDFYVRPTGHSGIGRLSLMSDDEEDNQSG